MAVDVRALRQHFEFRDPLVASAFFLRPGAPGTARMRQDGKGILRTVAAFADLDQANGRILSLAPMPDLVSLPFLAGAAYPAVMELGELPSATVNRPFTCATIPPPAGSPARSTPGTSPAASTKKTATSGTSRAL
ncbi:hypothetical protein GCM10009678_91870 [Actinomadura kijaniata]|uniref:Uncharacterized protein n=1 Tax=Actinomadura namibiensis TaxID=182080 RepID=A0A7W3LT93_ACTNM|nr:hypothetical protein [Actinomadura namibiensis]